MDTVGGQWSSVSVESFTGVYTGLLGLGVEALGAHKGPVIASALPAKTVGGGESIERGALVVRVVETPAETADRCRVAVVLTHELKPSK